jgi:hypothetical protein
VGSCLFRAFNDQPYEFLMPQMQAVKVAEGDNAAGESFLYFAQISYQYHGVFASLALRSLTCFV